MSEPSDHRPQKKWGQNFLRNARAVERIVDAVDANAETRVLEIGPGEGALTRLLLERYGSLSAIEIDPSLADRLQLEFGDKGLELVRGDAVTADLPETDFVAVGNLPYNVATPIVRRTIANPNCRRAVFMLQKEVADRMVARPGEDAFGFITLFVQLYADAKILLVLDPGSFHPRPKVKSAVVVFTPIKRELSSSRKRLASLISASFVMRRKKLINNLEGFGELGRTKMLEAISLAGIEINARAETLSLQTFDRLQQSIDQLSGRLDPD